MNSLRHGSSVAFSSIEVGGRMTTSWTTWTSWTSTLTATTVAGALAMPRLTAAEMTASTRPHATTTTRTTVTRRVVVSIPDRKLALLEDDDVVRVYPVAVGAPDTPSPVGTFTIVNRLTNPTYYRPGRVIPPGPSNPLGTRWLGLNATGFGIHGTDDADSIGYARSHGCIRMRNRDMERLFVRLQPGDRVELYAERTPEVERLFARR
jgi:lipoprotein-anchoring transpeptidase ErfK/SrfK